MARVRTGNKSGAPLLQDRVLAAKVRSLALSRVSEILEAGPPVVPAQQYGKKANNDLRDQKIHERDLYEALLRTMASASLPRLSEVSGPGGGPIEHKITDKEKKKLNSILNGKEIERESDGSDDDGEAE